MFVLIFCAEQHHSVSYEQCVLACCGPMALMICGVCIFLYSVGTDILYLIIIGDQWDKCERYFVVVAEDSTCRECRRQILRLKPPKFRLNICTKVLK